MLVVDLQDRRLQLSREMGAETGSSGPTPSAVVAAARDWAGGGGPPVVVRRDRRRAAVGAMFEMVASAGRAVQVGMSNEQVSLRSAC